VHFLAPLWLGALAALALPLALHLLSRGRGRQVPLASTRLLEGAWSVRGRRFNPSDLLLLAVRAALLAAVAMALAEPWIDAAPAPSPGSWLLLDPALGVPPDAEAAQALARWRREAAVVRFLAPGLPESDPGHAAGAPDVWSLLAEADRLAPPGAELRLATRGRLAELAGVRPALVHDVVSLGSGVHDGAVETALPAAATIPPALLAAGPAGGESVAAETARASTATFAMERVTVPLGGSARGLSAAAAGDRVRVTDAAGRALEIPRAPSLVAALRAAPEHARSAEIWRRACDAGALALGTRLVWSEQPQAASLRLWLDDTPPPPA